MAVVRVRIIVIECVALSEYCCTLEGREQQQCCICLQLTLAVDQFV